MGLVLLYYIGTFFFNLIVALWVFCVIVGSFCCCDFLSIWVFVKIYLF